MPLTFKLLALYIVASYSSSSLAQNIITGKVVGITDGDTLKVLDAKNMQHTVRLSWIDAPEKSQSFGNRAKQALAQCAAKKNVTVFISQTDRSYSRVVGNVMVGDVSCNEFMVASGFAWHWDQYKKYQPKELVRRYADHQLLAKAQRKGLWSDSEPIAPWLYRKTKR